MNEKIKKLYEEKAGIVTQLRAKLDLADSEKRGLNADETIAYEKMEARIAEIDKALEREKSLAVQEVELSQSANDPILPDPAKFNQNRSQESDIDTRAAFDRYLRGGERNLNARELRALQVDSDTAGGYLVTPQQIVNQLIVGLDNEVFVRRLATTYQVPNADSLGAPALDNDPADAAWTAEIAAGTEDSTMSIGKRELHPHPLAKYIYVSNTLLRKAPSAEGLVMDRFRYKFAVVEENIFLNGSGSNQPLGVFTASDYGITTSQDVSTDNTTSSITTDGLINAKYALKGQYHPRLVWIFHRDAVKQIRKLKDGEGQYIWQQGIVADRPDVILGNSVYMSEYAPNTFTTGLYVGIIGDFSFYWIADALSMTIQRLVELRANYNQTQFNARLECDGMPVLADAFRRVKLG